MHGKLPTATGWMVIGRSLRSAAARIRSLERGDLSRRRMIGFTLAIVVHLLGVALFYFMSPPITVWKPEADVKSIPLMNVFEKLIAPEPKPRGAKKRVEPRAAPPPEAPPPPPTPLNMIMVSPEVFAASDISQIPSRRSDAPAAAAGGNDDSEQGVGEGPGGAPLYNAEWYRRPTDAEMAYYMPKGVPRSGWGLVICKTAEDYRVEDCRELGESPAGVGIARAVRQAAWQFRVRPPRIGGKPMIGAWVRIRFDMTVGFKK